MPKIPPLDTKTLTICFFKLISRILFQFLAVSLGADASSDNNPQSVVKEKRIDESQEAIDDVRAAIDDLEQKLAKAKAKAKEIAEAGDDTWDEMKESLESGWNEASSKLEESWNSLTSTVKSFFS
jgi:DNA-binding ferritin-like protein